LLARIDSLPIDVLFVRDDDIVEFVEQGVCDAGIVGENVYKERYLGEGEGESLEVVRYLGFARCRLCFAARDIEEGEGVYSYMKKREQEGLGVRIATSYPRTVRSYFSDYGGVEVVTMSGAVELAPRLGIADAVVDLVSTGASMNAHGLEVGETLLRSEAVLLSGKGGVREGLVGVMEKLLCRVDGVLHARGNKYIMLHMEESRVGLLSDVIPGAESPTVLSLSGVEGIVAVHLVCHEDVFWETMEALRGLGARKILVLPIEKMMWEV
jgi:ATP phosphoribosyltransferase